jgi:nucleoside 2-deoxyribosyltransferase
MKYYFAARFSKRSQLRRYRKQLIHLGHTCTSQWLDGESDENAATAHRDLCDVEAADGLILFCETPRCATRGGRFIETGYALGLGKAVIAVGADIENIFMRLPDVQRFNTWPDCLAHLAKHGGDRRSAAVKNQVHNTHLKPAKRDRATIARRAA